MSSTGRIRYKTHHWFTCFREIKDLCVNLLLLFILTFAGQAQAQVKDIGSPFINNYPKNTYKASNQNWCIDQNDKGFMYFGNNDGLLEFDGKYWALYPLPGKTIVRSMLIKGDTVFAGGFEEMGYFLPDVEGRMKFTDISALIPEYFKSFDEIWKIHDLDQGIVFQSFRSLFIYKNFKIRVVEPFSNFGQSFIVNGSMYVVDRKRGLQKLTDRGLETVLNDPLFQRTEIRCLLPMSTGELLLGTSTEGLFTIGPDGLHPWNTPVNAILKLHELYTGITLSGDFLAFGTVQNGVYITDWNGKVFQHLNRSRGMQNNTVLSLFQDRHNNLWMALDNGIDYAEISSPISILDFNYNLEATYTSIEHNGLLYAGTNQGLFYIKLSALKNSAEDDEKFTLVPGTEGQVWCLHSFDNELLCGHNTGCFTINDGKATKISSLFGYWTFIRHRDKSDTLIAGIYNGLAVFTKKNDHWAFSHEVKGFKESSRTILEQGNTIWMSHGYRGIFSIELNTHLTFAQNIRLYKSSNGLPNDLPYNIHKIDQQFNVSTSEGLYRYDTKADRFYKNPKYSEIFKDLPYVDKIIKDKQNNLWFFTDNQMGVVRETAEGKQTTEMTPFFRINSMLLPSFEHLFIQDSGNVFIGSQEGLIHFSPRFNQSTQRKGDPTYLRSARFISSDSIFHISVTDKTNFKKDGQKLTLPYRFREVAFHFTSPSFEYPGSTRFSFRLRGYEEEWSPWGTESFKEYTNLKEGDYTFEVKSQNIYWDESISEAFPFRIKPPFHRSQAALVIYILFLMLFFAGNLVFIRRRIKKARLSEMLKRKKQLEEQARAFREQSLTAEKEIIHLKNEALSNEMKHKNKELANSTLNLAHKNKILTDIKEGFSQLYKEQNESERKHQISQLLKKINKEIKNEQYQEVFNDYFDEVHSDFVSRFKEAYPQLTPRELRLSAYLRMNLSSKEIAPLMNISVRGLEISRYRLRKKLNMDNTVNLTDFIMSF